MLINYSKYTVDELVYANEELKDAVKRYLIKPKLTEQETVAVRGQVCDVIIESFYAYFGQFPDPVVLYYLSNYMMIDFIKEPRSNKSKQEGSFKTPRQLRTVGVKEKTMEEQGLSALQFKRNSGTVNKKFTGNFDD